MNSPSETTLLRVRLAAVIDDDAPPNLEGSVYLHALACVYLAAEAGTGGEDVLEALYYRQAELERVDSDDVLTRLILLAHPEEGANAKS